MCCRTTILIFKVCIKPFGGSHHINHRIVAYQIKKSRISPHLSYYTGLQLKSCTWSTDVFTVHNNAADELSINVSINWSDSRWLRNAIKWCPVHQTYHRNYMLIFFSIKIKFKIFCIVLPGNPSEKETETITQLWQSSLFNAHYDVQRYVNDLAQENSCYWKFIPMLVVLKSIYK